MMFDGFTSRWTMPISCASASESRMPRMSRATRSQATGASRTASSRKVSPAMNSKTMKNRPFAFERPNSIRRTVFGDVSRDTTRPSRMKRTPLPLSWISLIATRRPVATSSARKTWDCPPVPRMPTSPVLFLEYFADLHDAGPRVGTTLTDTFVIPRTRQSPRARPILRSVFDRTPIPMSTRLLIDARYVDGSPSGIGRYTEHITRRLADDDELHVTAIVRHPDAADRLGAQDWGGL